MRRKPNKALGTLKNAHHAWLEMLHRNTIIPRKATAHRAYRPSPIRTITVGFGLSPNPPALHYRNDAPKIALGDTGHGLGTEFSPYPTIGQELHLAPKVRSSI